MTGRRLMLAAACVLLPRALDGQGMTTAAIEGTIVRADGAPLSGARITIVNASNGHRWETGTRSGGRYLIEDVGIGGPYRIEVRALGLAPATREGVVLALGERFVADFVLTTAAVGLPPITVTATVDPLLNPGRHGAGETISAARIAALPNIGRDFLTLTTLSPQTVISPPSGTVPTGGISISGQNRVYNSFQVDGGANSDLYTGGLPGRKTLPRPISLEAIEQVEVLAAPFDVRYGGFAGGLVTTVTRSGTNAVHASVFTHFQNAALSGPGVSGRLAAFRTWQYGMSVGGPVVRDRVQYFVSADVQQRVVPDPGPLLTPGPVLPGDVSYADAVRFQTILRDSFNLDPGTLGPVNGQQPARDLFGKISFQLGANNHLEASHHFASGENDVFAGRRSGLYALSSTAAANFSTANTSRLIWTSVIAARWSSETILSYLYLDDACRPAVDYPAISVRVGADLQEQVWAGRMGSCNPSATVQQDLELTENLTAGFGAHVVTLGVQGAALHFRDNLVGNTLGAWSFLNLDSLAAGAPSRYQRTLLEPTSAGPLSFGARELGIYLQDRWTPTPRLAITGGVRLDLTGFPDTIAGNDSLYDTLRIDSAHLPGGRIAWSPRVGFSYDVHGDGKRFVRGGVGLFTSRVPYQWISSAYRDNGVRESFLACPASIAPKLTTITLAQPNSTCTNLKSPALRSGFFDPKLELPQNLKVVVGTDQRLPWGVIGTAELLYTRAIRALYLTDANLLGPVDSAAGEGNRPLYGTITGNQTTVSVNPARWTGPMFSQVARVMNRSGDDALTLSAQLRKSLGARGEVDAMYAFSRARDRMSLVNIATRQNLEHTPLDGTLDDRALRPSYFDVPHKLQLGGTMHLPSTVNISLLYSAQAGTPYTYVIGPGAGGTADANADGIPTGQLTPDIIYVPLHASPGGDIELVEFNPITQRFEAAADSTYSALDSFIRAEPCLRNQRGRLLARNSCRNPWFGTLNARLTKAFPAGGRSVELVTDIYNLLNLIDRRWGLYRVTVPTPALPLLNLQGYDPIAQRGVYSIAQIPTLHAITDDNGRWSRWIIELGLRYAF
jgi:hypothetical protein